MPCSSAYPRAAAAGASALSEEEAKKGAWLAPLGGGLLGARLALAGGARSCCRSKRFARQLGLVLGQQLGARTGTPGTHLAAQLSGCGLLAYASCLEYFRKMQFGAYEILALGKLSVQCLDGACSRKAMVRSLSM